MNDGGFRFAGAVGLAVWLGAGCLFSFIAAPLAFKVLPREEAGRFVSAVFPLYYATGMVASAVALALLILEKRTGAPVPYAIGRASLMVVNAALLGASLLFILPAVHDLRVRLAAHEDALLRARFGMLHGVSMVLNLAALLASLAAIILAA